MNRRPIRLNRRQLRTIVEQAASTGGSIDETIDVIVRATVHEMAEHLSGDAALDAVTGSALRQVPDEQMMRPARYEDVGHYADIIAEAVVESMYDDVHRFAQQMLRTLMEAG